MEGLNLAYAVPMEEVGASYPALQAMDYRPTRVNQEVPMCLSEDSFGMLDETYVATLGSDPDLAYYGEDEVSIFKLPAGVRFTLLGIPGLFVYDKADGSYWRLTRGLKLKGTSKVTATRLPLLMLLPNGSFVLRADGNPQVFTLKLTSTKTKLLQGDKKDAEFKSIYGLNDKLKAHYGVKGQSLTHLVSVSIKAMSRKFSNGNDSSLGVMFEFEGGAKKLPEALQKQTFELLQDETVQQLIKDPFGLDSKPNEDNGEFIPDDVVNTDDVPF